MTIAHERLISRLFDTPLLYEGRKAETLARALGPRLAGQSVTVVNGEGGVDHRAFSNGRPSAGRLGDPMARYFADRERPPFAVIDGVAVIAIEGTLVHKGSWIGSESGDTSYQGLQVQVNEASKRRDVRGVVFEVDSFGGEVNGCFETAEAIRRLSLAKPTIAILTDYAYSAGYLLASQARTIVAPPFGGAGSIGVITMHADFSGSLEQDGIRVTVIKAGEHKDEGSPFKALDVEFRGRLQAQVDEMRDHFARVVSRGRGQRMTKAAALKTEARALTSPEALAIGMIDAIADPTATFDAFVAEINRSNPS